MLTELIVASFAALVFYFLFFGTVYYVADRLGYLDSEEEKRRRPGPDAVQDGRAASDG